LLAKDKRTWQVDHIKSHSEFKYTSMEDEGFKLCWALINLILILFQVETNYFQI